MSKFIKDYTEAYNSAVDLANRTGRDAGVRKTVEWGKSGFVVALLPKPENTFGTDLLAERVAPGSHKSFQGGEVAAGESEDGEFTFLGSVWESAEPDPYKEMRENQLMM